MSPFLTVAPSEHLTSRMVPGIGQETVFPPAAGAAAGASGHEDRTAFGAGGAEEVEGGAESEEWRVKSEE